MKASRIVHRKCLKCGYILLQRTIKKKSNEDRIVLSKLIINMYFENTKNYVVTMETKTISLRLLKAAGCNIELCKQKNII